MDISEFLASMQPTASDRALQRSSMMAIPDADGDPNTKDAAPAAAVGEDMNTPPADDASAAPDESYAQEDDDQPVTSFADGGEVDGDDDITGAVTGPDEPEQPTQGAIPDDQNTDDGGGAVTAANTPEGQEPESTLGDWKDAAHEAISKAIDYGYNKLHGVNRAVGGEQDEDHQASVKAMLSGAGALNPKQWDAALAGVDPEGSLDPQTKQLKGIGALNDFYGKKGPEQGAAAVWSALQLQRQKADTYRAHAVHSLDQGDDERAAKSAEGAFNSVPSGILTKITAGLKGVVDDYKNIRDTRVNQTGGIADDAGQGDVGKPDGGMDTPDGKGRITANKNGTFHVEMIDPDSKKMLVSKDLTKEQLTHALSTGGFTDRLLHQGANTIIGMASQVPEGQGQHLSPDAVRARQGQDVVNNLRKSGNLPGGQQPQGTAPQPDDAERNGLPRGMNIKNMSVGEISELRRRYAAGQVDPAMQRTVATNASRERIQTGNNASRERNVDVQQQGLNGRLGNAPGQQQQNLRAAASKAAADAKNETFKTPEERDAFIQKRTQFWQNQMRAPAQQQPQGGGDSGGGGAGAPKPGTVVRGYKYMGGPPHDPASWQKAQ